MPPASSRSSGFVDEVYGCFCCRRKGENYNPDVKCAYCYCIGVLIMVVFALLSLWLWDSDVRRLTHGFDFRGQLCGIDNDREYVYWCANEAWNVAGGQQYPEQLCYDCRVCLDHCPTSNDERIQCLLPNINNFDRAVADTSSGEPVLERLDMTVVQMVSEQPSYPSESWGGRYCLPKENYNNIRHDIRDNAYTGKARFGAALGSLESAWLVIMICAFAGVALGYLFIWIISHYAGICLFISMVFTVLICLVAGLFFIIGLFTFEEDNNWYQNANPFYESLSFNQARGWSIFLGFVLLILSLLLLLFTCRAIKRIDETIGMVAATLDCFHQNLALECLPLCMCLVMFGAVAAILLGLMAVYAVGEIEPRVEVNTKKIEGMERELERPWWSAWLVVLFAIWLWWTIEIVFACTQFLTSRIVYNWWLCNETKKVDGPKHMYTGGGDYTMARISGVDRVQDPRQSIVGSMGAGKVMIAPVGFAGPGQRDMINDDGNWNITYQEKGREIKNIGFGEQTSGLYSPYNLTRYLGSCCYGAIWIALTRIPRWIAHFIGVEFIYESGVRKKSNYDYGDADHLESKAKTSMWNGCGKCYMWIESLFGAYNGNALTELLLTWERFLGRGADPGGEMPYGFVLAAGTAGRNLNQAHGAVTFLTGALIMYEIFATFLAFWITWVIAVFLIQFVWWWNDEDSDWYVDNPALATIVAGIFGAIPVFLIMIVLSQTNDAMLYTFNSYRNGKLKLKEDKYLVGSFLEVVKLEYEDRPQGNLERRKRNRGAHLAMLDEGDSGERNPLLSTFTGALGSLGH